MSPHLTLTTTSETGMVISILLRAWEVACSTGIRICNPRTGQLCYGISLLVSLSDGGRERTRNQKNPHGWKGIFSSISKILIYLRNWSSWYLRGNHLCFQLKYTLWLVTTHRSCLVPYLISQSKRLWRWVYILISGTHLEYRLVCLHS